MANLMTITYEVPNNTLVSLKDLINCTFFDEVGALNNIFTPSIKPLKSLIKNVRLKFMCEATPAQKVIIGGYYIYSPALYTFGSGHDSQLLEDFLETPPYFQPVVLDADGLIQGNSTGSAFNHTTEDNKYAETGGNLFLLSNPDELLLNNITDPINDYYFKSFAQPMYISAHFTS